MNAAQQQQYLRELTERMQEEQQQYNQARQEKNWFKAGQHAYTLRELRRAKEQLWKEMQNR